MVPGGCRGPRGVAGFLGAGLAAGLVRGPRLGWPCRLLRGGAVPCRASPGPVAEPASARSPALPRGARSPSGGAPAAGRASARAPTGRCRRGRRRSPCSPALAVIWTSRSAELPGGDAGRPAAGSPGPRLPRDGRLPVALAALARGPRRSPGPRSRSPGQPCCAGGGDQGADGGAEPPVAGGGGQPGQVERDRARAAADGFPSGRDRPRRRGGRAFRSTASTGCRRRSSSGRGGYGRGLPRRVDVPPAAVPGRG